MKRTYSIVVFAALAACSLQIHGMEGREAPEPATRQIGGMHVGPTDTALAAQHAETIAATQARHAEELNGIQNAFTERATELKTTTQDQTAQKIAKTSTADLVAQLKSNIKGSLTLKQQADLADAINGLKTFYDTPGVTNYAKNQAFDRLNKALTKIARENGDTKFSHDTFFTSLQAAEKTGMISKVINTIQLSIAKTFGGTKEKEIQDATIPQVDVITHEIESTKQKSLQQTQVRHTQELANLEKQSPVASEFLQAPEPATRQTGDMPVAKISTQNRLKAILNPSREAPSSSTTTQTLDATFQSKINGDNPSDKQTSIATLLGEQGKPLTNVQLQAKLTNLNGALKLSYLRLANERNKMQIIQDFVKKIDPSIEITDENYGQVQAELEKISKFIGETSKESLAQNLKSLGLIPK